MDEEGSENTRPGCISGVLFHALNNNYWRKVSKGCGKSRTLLRDPNLRNHMKSLISEEPPKKKNYRLMGSKLQAQPKFRRTFSIHHLECSDYVPRSCIQSDTEVKKVPKNLEIEEETSLDFWELYRANKDLFSKIQKYTDGGIEKSFCKVEISKSRVKLMRSGSYPSPKLSKVRNFESRKLDHKEIEIWSHSNVDKLLTLSMNESSSGKYDQLLTKKSIWEPNTSLSERTNDLSIKRVRSLSRIYSYDVFQNEPPCDGYGSVLGIKGDRDKKGNVDSYLCEDIVKNDSNEEMEDISELVESISEDDTDQVEKVPENMLSHSNSLIAVHGNPRYEDFNYIRDILARSGLDGNDIFAPWYSLDQPLNPSVFEDVEACCPHKDDLCCHHQLLFDLTNEILVQIYDTLFTYYPRALSSSCHVAPISKKFDVLGEVWGRVRKRMNLEAGLDPTIEDIVIQDLWSDNMSLWMNLQLESEFVALELEDMFFGELLEEIILFLRLA